jgi:ABC-type transport system involved in multi-copper enzyme maturation permease subunit
MRVRLSTFGLPILAKELVEMAERPRTYRTRIAFAVLLFSMAVIVLIPIYRVASRFPFGLLGQGAHVLNVLYAFEWCGLCLFVPVLVSDALTAEKERNTLQLLFLTRLGPWTILLEKLLSRFVPVASFLLVSIPAVFVAYLLGGVTGRDIEFAAVGLVATAFQIAGISLFCSAFCATSTAAFLMSYVLIGLVLLFPFFTTSE